MYNYSNKKGYKMKYFKRMIKTKENEWQTNSDICGYVVKLINGYYEVYSFDECEEDIIFEEKDTNLSYLKDKYNFEDLETIISK